MFLDETTENEFFASLEKGMHKHASFEENMQDDRMSSVAAYLTLAAKQLQNANLVKEAQMVMKVKEVCDDSASKGLTPTKMLKNLAEKGWVFNADDGHDPDVCDIDDCGMCSEGEEPQLRQDELKSIRHMLESDSNQDMDSGDKQGIEGMFENMDPEDRKSMLQRLNEMF